MTLVQEDIEYWTRSKDYRFCRCGAQFRTMEALTMHIKTAHLQTQTTTLEGRKDNTGIGVECPNCNYIDELKGLAGWSFIILKTTKCKRCNSTITHDNIVDD